MKRRLGILGIVLAASVWLWFSYQPQATWTSILQQLPATESSAPRSRVPAWTANWSTASEAAVSEQSQSALTWLDATIDQLEQIPPFTAKTRMDIHLFEDTLQVDGRYQQTKVQGMAGQAGEAVRHLYRWDFEFASEPEPIRTSQMFDGRFFYSLHINSGERLLEYVDLYQVPQIVDRQEGKLAPPSAWAGTGGLVKILQHARSCFEFHQCESVAPPTPAGMPFQVLRGQWKVEALKQLLRGQVAPHHLEPEIIWDRLPKQLPHAVEIWIGSDEHLSKFPYRLMFYQYVEDSQTKWKPQLMFATTLYELEFPGELPIENFQVDTTGVQPIELTKDYYDRIRMYLTYPVE